MGDLLIAVLAADWICILARRHHPHEHNHPQDVGVTHWKPGSGQFINERDMGRQAEFSLMSSNNNASQSPEKR